MRRWILRIAFGVAGLFLLAVAAAATFVATFDAEDYKQEIADAVEAATGHKLKFDGKIEASILTFQPAIRLNGVALLNPPGFSRANFASAKRVDLILRLRPLLQRRLAIVRLEVEGADVQFEANEKGERNWVPARAAPKLTAIPAPAEKPRADVGTGRTIAGLTVDRFVLKHARIGYLHSATKLETAIALDEVTITLPSLDKPIELAIAGTFDGTRIETSGTVGSLAAFLAPQPGTGFPIALKLAYGRSQLDIDLKTDLTAKLPSASGRITAKRVDLDELAPPRPGAAKRSDGRLFSAAPLPLGLLNAFDAKGEIKIDELVVKRQRLRDVSATVTLKGGTLEATPFALTLAGARVEGDLKIEAGGDVPAVALKAKGTGVQLREVTQLLFERATMSSSLAFTAAISGRGRSMREIAGTLAGPVVVALGPGPINTNVLDFLSKDIFSIARRDQLSLICGLARFDFARGVGASRRIVIDTTRATAYGAGWVSLGAETLDITFVPTTKGKSLASVAAIVPVRVHGALRRPSATPDLSRTPEEVAKSILGVVELPGEILGSILGSRPGGSRRVAGCGGTPTAAAPQRGNNEGLINRGGDVLKRINPFR
ncbi:MAG: AsmA family protein [Rhodospirillaceae bacterium]|nr:AsmA family protein [Rhodospirillaceae bacterium]